MAQSYKQGLIQDIQIAFGRIVQGKNERAKHPGGGLVDKVRASRARDGFNILEESGALNKLNESDLHALYALIR
jgi:hypothetical protein